MIASLAAGVAPAWAQDTDVKVVAAGDPAQALSRANDAYGAGDFAAAIAGYRALLDAGHDHPLLHYDLGNAYLRDGELGRAIASYRRAAAGAPRDQDVRRQPRLRAQDRARRGGSARAADGVEDGVRLALHAVALRALDRRRRAQRPAVVAAGAALVVGATRR